MSDKHIRRENETLTDYKERLYRNRVRYKLDWQEVANLLGKNEHFDHTRKTSYGYLERINDEKEIKFDKSVMIINDLHLPFERDDTLLARDLMDCQSISFFPKIRTLTLEEELIYTYDFLKEVRRILNNE